jgi:hypothetical protein
VRQNRRTWRAHGRMNGRSFGQHGRPQGHRPRLGFVRAFFGFRLRWRLACNCLLSRFRFGLGDFRRSAFPANAFPANAFPANDGFRGRGRLGDARTSLPTWRRGCGSRFRFLLLNSRSRAVPVRRGRQGGMRLTAVVPAQLIGFVLVDRTGVGDLFRNAEFVQFVDDLARLHFQLPRQLIDANLTHNLKRFV